MWQPKSDEYYEGMREGIRRWAFWKNGTQYVGTTGTTLAKALQEVTDEQVKFTLEK